MISLVSVETTPNPNSMKLNLKEPLGITGTYTRASQQSVPSFIQELLQIPGVESIFGTASFVTLNRDPRIDWPSILDAARQIFDFKQPNGLTESTLPQNATQQQSDEEIVQTQVLVQTFRNIPIQVKVTHGTVEERVGIARLFCKGSQRTSDPFWCGLSQGTSLIVFRILEMFPLSLLFVRRSKIPINWFVGVQPDF